jgi:thiol-disulfide isomerase/thioredoxin
MALKYSSMLELGTTIPEFELINVLENQMFSSLSLENNRPTLLMLICNHCPYVIHYHEELQRITKDFNALVDLVAISSNDAMNYPQDGPEEMKVLFDSLGLSFPYLYDETQNMAKVLQAQCTPEFYLYNGQGLLVYRGRLDDSSPGNDIKVSGKDLRDAINALLDGQSINEFQQPSMGCSIKWK